VRRGTNIIGQGCCTFATSRLVSDDKSSLAVKVLLFSHDSEAFEDDI
jgi:hypothetical protein